MAITNDNLVKFGYGVAEKASTTAGHISFASDTRQLFVGDGEKAVAFAGNVANAVFADKKLTITYNDGTAAAVLDFSDVASAEGVSSLLGGLRKDVEANKTSISNLTSAVDTSIKALDASYKAADASLAEDIEKVAQDLADAIGEGGNVAEQIETAVSAEAALRELADSSIRTDFAAADKALGLRIDGVSAVAEAAQTAEEVQTAINNKVNALAGTATGADASGFVTVKVDTAAGQVSNVTVTGSDIASAATLADVKGRLDTFLKDASLESTVDTLKEIQDWINGDGVDATELTQAIAEEARLRGDADNALGLRIDGVKATADAAATKNEFDAYVSSNDAALAGVKATADAAAVKTSVDASLDLKADKTALAATDASITAIKNSYVISFGGAKGEISVDTNNNTRGEVKFTMDGSTLKGAVNGLGSAAFEASTAFDASGSAATAKSEAIRAVTGTADDASNVKTIEGTRKYAEELVAAVPAATVTGVNSESKADAKGYVTIALELNNKNVAVNSVAVDTQAVADATEANDGLATAYDVKQYVDAKDASMDERMDVVEAQLKWVIL